MIDQLDIHQILFLDIETVSEVRSFDELSDTFKSLWSAKSRQVLKLSNAEELSEEMLLESYTSRAAIFAEFGKIVCISVGFVALVNGKRVAKFKSFSGVDEKQLLSDFVHLLNKHYDHPEKQFLCGHNVKEFDVPYICRRLMIHQLAFPKMLNLHGKKPWETKHLLDTMELWKFGDGKAYTSLKLLTATLGIPSPKDDIDGSQVGTVFWEDNDVPRIAKYCEKDVLAVIQLMLRFKYFPLLTAEEIVFSFD
jgi:uncharacterized protein YprB with RNaseH-like and TPR domain